jgi:hypothetical protein
VALSTICSVGILVRSLHPEKRLNVDHVTRTHIIKVPAHHVREIEKARIGLPSRAGFVAEIETVAFGCFPGDCWLQVHMNRGLRQKSHHCQHRPGEHAGLAPRQTADYANPIVECVVLAPLPPKRHVFTVAHRKTAGVLDDSLTARRLRRSLLSIQE